MKLSENFTLEEFTRSSTAVRLNIDNSLPIELMESAELTVKTLCQPIRNKFGPTRINSGYRCPDLNRAIGSSDRSQHTKAQAVDIEVMGVDNLKLMRWCKEHLPYDQLILEFYTLGDPNSGWVHISTHKGMLREQVLTITSNRNVIHGIHA